MQQPYSYIVLCNFTIIQCYATLLYCYSVLSNLTVIQSYGTLLLSSLMQPYSYPVLSNIKP